ncbi:MAG TPA: hypothetical protein PLA50_19060, partial [Bacteroidia bacterium]|nr:hypothetical protein [Bacteroidia bacterium]
TNDTGKTLAFSSDASTSSSGGSSSKKSIGYVEVSEPGKLTVSVSGDFEERVFSFSQSIFPKMFLAILGGGTASLLMAFIGFGVGIWGVIKIVRNKTGEQ